MSGKAGRQVKVLLEGVRPPMRLKTIKQTLQSDHSAGVGNRKCENMCTRAALSIKSVPICESCIVGSGSGSNERTRHSFALIRQQLMPLSQSSFFGDRARARRVCKRPRRPPHLTEMHLKLSFARMLSSCDLGAELN
jgi:hypothetical protein